MVFSIFEPNFCTVCITPQDIHLIGTTTHPSCRASPSQTRLSSSVGFHNALFRIKNVECFKAAGSGLEGTAQRHVHGLLPVRSSLDDEFRSSRNIAIGLHRRYRNVIERGCGENLREFIKAGVTAYAVGCTDEGLRKELISLKNSDIEVEGISSTGGSTGLKSKITTEEVRIFPSFGVRALELSAEI
eukprot:Gb_41552 [translate_table: standard]